jgi:DNA-binding IclR family transcriptional regulator
MRSLTEAARQSCHLAILTDCEITVIAQVNSPEPMYYAVTLGARFPVEETSSGLVLLAGLPEDTRVRVVQNIAQHGSGRRAVAELQEHLRPVLRNGFDVRPSLVVPGVINISFPVYGLLGSTVAALTTPFLPVRHDAPPLDVVKAAVAEAARTISAALGYADTEERVA